MKTIDRATSLITQTEAELKSLVAQAAQEGEYDAVVLIAEWAKTVSNLRASPQNGAQVYESSAATVSLNNSQEQPGPHPPTASRKDRKKGSQYPAFVRDGDNLVKIAWSKASKSEYQHKAPKTVVLILLGRIATLRTPERLFSMEAILPLKDGSGVEIPAYQSYLALAWLRQLGLVRQHGRQGYSLKKGIDLAAEVSAKWEKLPQRRAL